MTHRQQIGSKIQELRVLRGLSVRQLAEMSGVIYSNISKIENGRYNVSVDILGKIADALGVELTMIEKEAE
jgi:transcriptional regulator with XRE-family HTH domain